MTLFGVPLSESTVWPGTLTGSRAGVHVAYSQHGDHVTLELRVRQHLDAIKLYASEPTAEACLQSMRMQLASWREECDALGRVLEAGL